MLKIVLTGGIGTGKTYLSKHFIDMGIPVFFADEEAKLLYKNEDVIQFIKNRFGNQVFTNQTIDFQKLAQIVFSNPAAREDLNNFIHPLVFKKFEAWAREQKTTSVIMESAIIFEVGLDHLFDKIIVVDAPLKVRISRIMERSPHLSEKEIIERIETQLPQEEKCKKADIVIFNP